MTYVFRPVLTVKNAVEILLNSISGLELYDTEMEQVWRPLADNSGKWYVCVFCYRQRLSHSINCEIFENSQWREFEKIGIKVDENLRVFGLSVFRTSTLPCKLGSGQTCVKNFCSGITGPKKKIPGYGYGGSGAPKFCTAELKVAQIAFFAKIGAYGHELRFFFFTPYFYFRFGLNYMSVSLFCL